MSSGGGPPAHHSEPTTTRWKRGYLWVTVGFLALSLLGHWLFAWFAYRSEARALGRPIDVGDYAVETARDTFENWQSEFLQLIWQVCGLAFFLYVGSPQSREGHDRVEEKIDYLLSRTAEGSARLEEIDRRYMRDG